MHTNQVEHTSNVVGGGSELRADDMLMIYRCMRCEKLLAPITSGCSSCGSDDLESVPSSGAGSVVSWRVVDRAPTDRQGGLVPLTIAIVELDEGPWVYTSLEGEIPSSAGPSVRVQFQPHPREGRFPVFAVSTRLP
ncbi:OB-fold domain-containing protein [Nocardia sp. NPDC047038]|uniref:Zn-ribbon domain-containing OB-fold protein n=1 Tax=Nocardia sp. NPDC047038 TaxID=3154338 RepID=UPI0033E44283